MGVNTTLLLAHHKSKQMLHKSIIIPFWVLLFIALMGCGGEAKQTDEQDEKLYIVTTTGMIADALENIAGDKAKVEAIMGTGVDPHVYKATQGDLKMLSKADIIFYNGLHLEGKMSDVLQKLSRQKTTVAVAEGVPQDSLLAPEEYEGAHDPHIWFDLELWAQAVDHAAERLAVFDEANSSHYRQNADQYIEKLRKLDQWVTKKIATIPDQQRVMITAHDAFSYFGKAYDIEVKGLQGISTVSEFGLKDVTNMVDLIVRRNIQAVFVESSVSERSLNAVMEGCKKRGHEVEIGGTLYSDALGPQGTQQGEFLGMVRHNVTTIVTALKGDTDDQAS